MARTAAAALAMTLLLAAGCGFQPVHGSAQRESAQHGIEQNESARHVWLANLRAARLQVPQSAVGWQLARFLRAHQSGANAPEAADNAAWRLTVGLSLGRDDLLLQRDSQVIRGAVRLQGRYALLDEAGEELLSGRLRVSAAYNRAGGGFANEIALRNAEERAARELAEQLWRRLLLAGAQP